MIAAIAPNSGSSHSTGLRYTISRMSATITSAVSSSLVCWFPPLLSAFTAAWPVTSATRPSPALPTGPAIAALMSLTASLSTLPELAWPVMFTVNAAASPSADGRTAPGAARPAT